MAGLVRAGRVPEALTLVERRRARELEDQLAAAHTFDDQTGSRLAVGSARPAILVSLPTDSATAVLEFVGAGQGQPTTAFVLTSRGVTGVILAPLDSLRGDVAGFARLVVAGGATGPIGTRLRRALFDPLAAVIPPGTHRLVLVSDDALHHLPWEALPLEGGDALGERFVVSHAPAAAIAATLRAGPSRAAPARVLAFGDPAFASATPAGPYHEAFDAVGGLPPLPGAATEAKMAARYGDGSISRIGPGASEAFLKRAQLADFAVLHFASHALVDERSLTSTAQALAPGEGEDGFLTLSEIGTMRLAGSLVVLSACRTAAGVVVSGEGVQGLASALLAAGARAVLATRWLVEDASAAALMQDFYRELAGGRGVDEALLAAQGAARARGAGPREWAGFMVFGDGAMSIPLRPPRPRRWPVALLGAALLAGTAWLVRRRRMGGSEGAAQPSSYHRG